jgi:hypothetical protein
MSESLELLNEQEIKRPASARRHDGPVDSAP